MSHDATWDQELIQHQAFLRRLARSLVRDEAFAEDLVQDAYLVALKGRPREEVALRAWLATILRRLAGRARRSATSRQRREADSARSMVQTGEDPSRRIEAHMDLLQHLRGLPKDEMRVLFLRYGDDLTPSAIASYLNLPLATVKTRLRRGRERLRSILDSNHGQRSTWLRALSPLASGPVIKTASTSTFTIMTTGKLVTCIAAGVLTVALGLFLRHDSAAPSQDALIPEETGALLADIQPGEERNLRNLDSARRSHISPSSEPAAGEAQPSRSADLAPSTLPWWVKIQILGPIPSSTQVKFSVNLDSWGEGTVAPWELDLDASGCVFADIGPAIAELEDTSGGRRAARMTVDLLHPDLPQQESHLRLPDPLGEERTRADAFVLEIPLQEGSILTGSIANSEPDQEAKRTRVLVYRAPKGYPVGEAITLQKSDDRGNYRLVLDAEGSHILVGIQRGHRPVSVPVDLVRGETLELETLTLRRGEELHGTARGIDDKGRIRIQLDHPGPTVPLHWAFEDWTSQLAWNNGQMEYSKLQVHANSNRQYHVSGLAPLPYRVSLQNEDTKLVFRQATELKVVPSARLDLDSPYSSVIIRIERPSSSSAPIEGQARWTRGDEERNFGLDIEGPLSERRYDLPPGELLGLQVTAHGYEPISMEISTPAAGQTSTQTLSLTQEQDLGELVLDLQGIELEEGTSIRIRQSAHSSGEKKYKGKLLQGLVRIPDVEPGPKTFELVVGGDWFTSLHHICRTQFEANVPAGGSQRVSIPLTLGGTLVAQAFDTHGNRHQVSATIYDSEGKQRNEVFVASLPNGRVAGFNVLFDSAPSRIAHDLPPGDYSLSLQASPYQSLELPFVIRPGETTELNAVLVE